MSRREEILRDVGVVSGRYIDNVELALADRVVELEEKLAALDRLSVELGSLHARCEELERDRERLDWFTANPGEAFYAFASERWHLVRVVEKSDVEPLGYDGPRAAIDAAMNLDAARAQEEKA